MSCESVVVEKQKNRTKQKIAKKISKKRSFTKLQNGEVSEERKSE